MSKPIWLIEGEAFVSKAIEKWNSEADEHNQWSELGEDEKLAFVAFNSLEDFIKLIAKFDN